MKQTPIQAIASVFGSHRPFVLYLRTSKSRPAARVRARARSEVYIFQVGSNIETPFNNFFRIKAHDFVTFRFVLICALTLESDDDSSSESGTGFILSALFHRQLGIFSAFLSFFAEHRATLSLG